MSDSTDESAAFLMVRHKPEGSIDIGELIVRAQANGFAGASAAYFKDSAVLAFAARLAEYPLSDKRPPALSAGHGEPGIGAYEEHVAITVAPVGSLGQLGVLIHLAEIRPDRSSVRSEVRLELLTTYERIRQFSRDLERVVKGQQPQATLAGETLA